MGKGLAALCLAVAVLLCGCGRQEAGRVDAPPAETAAAEKRISAQETDRSFFAMDTVMRVRAYGADEETLDRAAAWISDLEQSISTTVPDSRIAAVNREGTATLDAQSGELLRRALALCEETDGALDITIYPVVRAWGFTTGNYRVPSREELKALLSLVDYRLVTRSEENAVAVPSGMQIDLGSVAKGYAGDRVCELLRACGVESALLDLGGNVQALGAKPDGSDWNIGIRDPQGEGLLGTIAIRDRAVVTSGGYERFFEDEAGEIWWHILDPTTGMPVKNGLISVTVIGEEGLVCDALSTALFVMGEERAIEFWRTRADFEMILVAEDGTVLLTPGIGRVFTPDRSSVYEYETIEAAQTS